MTTVHGLRPAAVAVYTTIRAHITAHGQPPTYDQIAAAVGQSKPVMAGHLAVLEARGWVVRPGAGPGRRVQLTDKTWGAET